jgi:hypothetical protein
VLCISLYLSLYIYVHSFIYIYVCICISLWLYESGFLWLNIYIYRERLVLYPLLVVACCKHMIILWLLACIDCLHSALDNTQGGGRLTFRHPLPIPLPGHAEGRAKKHQPPQASPTDCAHEWTSNDFNTIYSVIRCLASWVAFFEQVRAFFEIEKCKQFSSAAGFGTSKLSPVPKNRENQVPV